MLNSAGPLYGFSIYIYVNICIYIERARAHAYKTRIVYEYKSIIIYAYKSIGLPE